MLYMTSNIIGQNVRKYREKNHWNQSFLAEKLNIQRQTVSSYERGSCLPNIYVLIQMADLFGVSLDELVGRSENLNLIQEL